MKAARMKRPSKPKAPSVEILIGQRIRALRQQRDVTLDQLASEVKLTKGQVSRIENGLVSSPVSTLTRIAAALGVGPGAFFQSDGTIRRAICRRRARASVFRG